MTSPHTSARAILTAVQAIAVASAAFTVLPLGDSWVRTASSDVWWTASALLATGACVFAARHARDGTMRRVWQLLAVGCTVWFLGQMVWNYHNLVLGRDAAFPSLADVGYLGLYPFAIAAVVTLYRRSEGGMNREVALDAVLVTIAVGTAGYFLLLSPLLRGRATAPLELVTSIAWQLSAVGLLWVLALLLLHRTEGFGSRALPALLAGLGAHALSNFAYAGMQVTRTYHTGHPIDFGWTLGLCLIAAAASLDVLEARRPLGRPGSRLIWPRILPTAMGFLAFASVGLYATLNAPLGRANTFILVGLFAVWAVVVLVRVGYALAADRRYAERLEQEVARQTMSLMDSLSATGAAERQLRQLMEAVPDAIMALDRDGRILDLNQSAGRLVAAANAKPGRMLWEYLETENAALVRENLESAFRGETRHFDVHLIRDDGSRGVSAIVYSPVWEGREVTRVLALARDVTDQRRLELQLAQADKLAALGQLVSGVAHEINNPAATISGLAQTLIGEKVPADQREILQLINEEAVRIGRITRNLLAFARATRSERALVDLNEIVRRTYALRAYHLSTLDIRTNLDLDEDPPSFWGDVSQIQQVLLNLLINAEHALQEVPSNRSVTLTTRKDDREVRLSVSDTGPGVPAAIQGKIFDPFFTTKPEGEGTGLGLSISYGIVRHHGGRIWVEGNPGGGAAFHVSLPLDRRKEPRAEPRVSRTTLTGQPQFSLLVVDDEQGWRNALLRYLNRRGHRGLGVPDARSGLQLLAREEFDILVADAHLAGLNGRAFVDAVRSARPQLARRVIFTTADVCPESVRQVVEAEGLRTVSKPLEFEELERTIHRILRG